MFITQTISEKQVTLSIYNLTPNEVVWVHALLVAVIQIFFKWLNTNDYVNYVFKLLIC